MIAVAAQTLQGNGSVFFGGLIRGHHRRQLNSTSVQRYAAKDATAMKAHDVIGFGR